ncbi:glycosyltransferase family 2 protein [Falsiroseomonas tokyonensis]|uniref:Glycosyltransferase family 2 protein n=1 Tax=Falsiroseomonas tokyonensis TaxID=430521 RepID=A0ABV7BVR6_9PROT|nr:glycosyltransferase family 2 protein [Falsiroseomonas tokyonensis]MBU8538705.1 glycosyltransferase family 2 protein [Falsiroseomonas tokyonensis]
MRLAIGIATRGRAVILGEVLDELRRQTRAPDRVLVCHVTEEDIAGLPARFPQVQFMASPAGLPRQRNAILDAVGDCDAVLFLDDDFLPMPDYLAVTERVLMAHPDCVVTTGTVIADGAKGPGLSVAEGRALLAADVPPEDALAVTPHFNGYGCNMAFRLAPLRTHGIRVDESLPLYGWYEDIDVTRALGRHGSILRLAGARGVHLGAKSGRVSGLRLGYSQVANPVYLARKGTFPWSHAIPSAARHTAMNALRSLAPEPHVDRFGRFRGNLIALTDLLRGRAHPARILEL